MANNISRFARPGPFPDAANPDGHAGKGAVEAKRRSAIGKHLSDGGSPADRCGNAAPGYDQPSALTSAITPLDPKATERCSEA